MKRSVLFALLSLFFGFLSAQDKSKDFKPEVEAFFDAYESCIAAFADTTLPKAEANKRKRGLIDLIESTKIKVPNDLNNAANDSLIRIKSYLFLIEKEYPGALTMALQRNKMEVSKLFIDEPRNSWRITARVKKRLETTRLQPIDSIAVVDSASGEESVQMVYDTVVEKSFADLIFYFRTTVEFKEFTPLKLEAIQLAGKDPVYHKALEPMEEWWIGLSPKWKERIRAQVKLPEVPTAYHLKRVERVAEINLEGTTLEDLPALRMLKGLKKLDLSGLELDTLLCLDGFDQITELILTGNQLKTLYGIENCPKLESLSANNNELFDISAVKNCPNLMFLNLNANQITDIDALRNLTRLFYLNLGSNKLIDIKALEKHVALRNFNIAKNKDVESLLPIINCKGLQKLTIFNTGIASLYPIRDMTGLLLLNMAYTQVTTLDDIRNLTNLGTLNIGGNKITDFSALNRFDKIRSLGVAKTSITDISPIMKMTYIKELKAHHSKLSKNDIQRFKKKYPKCEITYY